MDYFFNWLNSYLIIDLDRAQLKPRQQKNVWEVGMWLCSIVYFRFFPQSALLHRFVLYKYRPYWYCIIGRPQFSAFLGILLFCINYLTYLRSYVESKAWFPLNVSVIATNLSCLLTRTLLRFAGFLRKPSFVYCEVFCIWRHVNRVAHPVFN